jgi:hypothetical protein
MEASHLMLPLPKADGAGRACLLAPSHTIKERLKQKHLSLPKSHRWPLLALMDGQVKLARETANGQQRAARGGVKRVAKMASPLPDAKSPAGAGLFLRAADGIRTHDLLHGKQTL